MVQGHKIIQKVEINKFLSKIKRYGKEDIETTDHTFFHFNEEQQKIFNKDFLKNKLFIQKPILVGIQNNSNWALFYEDNGDIFKIIVEIQSNKIYIVTFYKIDRTQIPII